MDTYRKEVIGAILIVTVFCLACSSGATPFVSKRQEGVDADAKPVQNDPPRSGSSDDLELFFAGTPPGLKEAWRLFVSDGRYRMARRMDFKIPEWAVRKYGTELDHRLTAPIEGGRDLNGDGVWYDCAVIVLDTTRTDANRFGIVVLDSNGSEEQLYQIHWLYHDRNLAATILMQLGEKLFVIELNDAGSRKTCEVQWDKKLLEYHCE